MNKEMLTRIGAVIGTIAACTVSTLLSEYSMKKEVTEQISKFNKS